MIDTQSLDSIYQDNSSDLKSNEEKVDDVFFALLLNQTNSDDLRKQTKNEALPVSDNNNGQITAQEWLITSEQQSIAEGFNLAEFLLKEKSLATLGSVQVDVKQESDIGWQVALNITANGQVESIVGSSEGNMKETSIKLFLWGSIATGKLSYLGDIQSISASREPNSRLYNSQNSTVEGKGNRVISLPLYTVQFATASSDSKSFANANLSQLDKTVKLGQLYSGKLNREVSSPLLNVLLPQRLQVIGEGKETKLWIRDYLSTVQQQKNLIAELLTNANHFNHQFTEIIVNGKSLLVNNEGG